MSKRSVAHTFSDTPTPTPTPLPNSQSKPFDSVTSLEGLINYIMYDLPPGPRQITISTVVNLQKAGMPFYLAFLVLYYQNFSDQMLMYAVLHGSYGLLWYSKHLLFPDETFKQKQSLGSALALWVLILGPYCVAAFLIASGICKDEEPSQLKVKARLYGACALYILGICLTLCSDQQKTTVLQLKRSRKPVLICDGFYAYTRNPNYLGEMMLYFAFAMVCNHWAAYWILAVAWLGLFSVRIWQKERSYRRKEGWEEYRKRSWILLPKINGKTADSVLVYSVLAVLAMKYWTFIQS